jgi:hypothetical protein
MMLDDYVKQQVGERHRHGGKRVSHFSFGEYYTVHLEDGHGYAVPDLELMLAIVADEFEGNREFVPALSLANTALPKGFRGIGQAEKRELVVTAQRRDPDSFLPPPSLPAVVRHIRSQVTYYNLSGTWDHFLRSNL